MGKYVKKPVVIDAIQITRENIDDVIDFVSSKDSVIVPSFVDFEKTTPIYFIHTLEGVMRACVGDWIIKGIKGEFYPCKPDIFNATYKPIDDGATGNLIKVATS